MPVEFTYQCTLASGLHARPCSYIAEIAGRFTAEVSLTNRRNDRVANGKSVLSLLSADVLMGDDCAFVLSGVDESSASAALQSLLEKDLAAQEEALPALASVKEILPRALRLATVQAAFGTPLSPGFGQGALLFADGIRLPELGKAGVAAHQQLENQKLLDAISALRNDFANMSALGAGPARGIVNAQLAILDDPAFAETLSEHIEQGNSAGDAIVRTARAFSETLASSASAYIRERVVDIQEVSLRLYEAIYGKASADASLLLDRPTVLIAENLGAQELLHLDRTHLRGIVFGDGQATSHAVILARSLGIPAIAGAADVKRLFAPGADVILDGHRAYVVPASPETQRFYQREHALDLLRRETLRQYATITGSTADARSLEIAANVSSPEEAEAAFANGCDGIGLFRTEMLFVGRDAPPSEEEQFAAYARAARAANGKPVILRTFDVGGDKPVAFLTPKADLAPGRRGILIYKEYPELLRAQLRAMLRASALGKVWIMVPLVSTADEILWLREQLSLAQQALHAQEKYSDPQIQLGVMVELSSAVPNLGAIAAHADFFSIGTNDLAQYFFAEDRTRSQRDLRTSVREPAFLRLLQTIASQARLHKKWLGMCGEMAGDPHNLPLLVGLGLDELSIGGNILGTKHRLAKLTASACAQLLEKALAGESVEDVDALRAAFSAHATLPLVDPALVIPTSQSCTRDEAIRELADLVYLHDRTADADRLEDVLWEREVTYSTDMGLGFALPHCKSDAVQHSSIAMLHTKKPFLWSAESTVPVRAVIMLAMKNDAGAHMQVLAKLARRLMDEQFRERLLTCTSGQDAVQLLTHEVGIT